MKIMELLYFISLFIVIIGSINWGLVGIADFDLVKLIFGEKTSAAKTTYILVGLSGLYLVFYLVIINEILD